MEIERLTADLIARSDRDPAWRTRLSPEDASRWELVRDPDADQELDADDPSDAAAIEFLGDDEAVEAFLRRLAQEAPRTAGAPAEPHSAAFVAVRNRLLALERDDDRAAIARLFGAIGRPQADPSPDTLAVLRGLADLGDEDAVKFARWCRRYLTAEGRVERGRPA